jgi:hypothetical protein
MRATHALQTTIQARRRLSARSTPSLILRAAQPRQLTDEMSTPGTRHMRTSSVKQTNTLKHIYIQPQRALSDAEPQELTDEMSTRGSDAARATSAVCSGPVNRRVTRPLPPCGGIRFDDAVRGGRDDVCVVRREEDGRQAREKRLSDGRAPGFGRRDEDGVFVQGFHRLFDG